ncbi:hypothetical protein [Streptomyces narbonensis]|uniref:hypothetical protein n=1 Tax=Streptomyces narbonensis TaxID=67333 RepID=UPI0019C9AD8F|nr:hypothetical protein [Streptomyces narbonensis]GGW09323.1 hypothetical protein GCM10010230_58380 [Streptomyces narbonensis]
MFAISTGSATPACVNSQPTARQAFRRGEILGSRIVDTVGGPDIDHPSPPVHETYELVRSVTTSAFAVVSAQPERL